MPLTSSMTNLAAQLERLAEHWARFSEAELLDRTGPGRWSRKEILGHLIDSAANNHGRFVVAQVAPQPLKLVAYDQDAWVRLADYQHWSSAELLALWTSYNRLILHLLAQIPASALAIECSTLNNNPVTLRWLIDDYVLHLEHHVQQIIYEYAHR